MMNNFINYEKEFKDQYKIGDVIKVSHQTYNKYVTTYTIVEMNLNDSFGQVRMFITQIINDCSKTNESFKIGQQESIVEYQWFNEQLTGRIIEKIYEN